MGATSIYGNFISSKPYMRLITECYKDQVNHNFNYYTGSIGMINNFREDKQIEDKSKISYELRSFIENHKDIKTKEQAIEGYLYEKLRYCQVGELVYVVDKSTVAGYEVTTYGGYREVPLSTVNMDEIERYLDESGKGYTVFKLSQQRDGISIKLRPELKGKSNLKEIEGVLKADIIKWQNIYFAIKNDMSKVYMFAPNIKLQKNKVKSDETKECREAHPVYYVGMAIC